MTIEKETEGRRRGNDEGRRRRRRILGATTSKDMQCRSRGRDVTLGMWSDHWRCSDPPGPHSRLNVYHALPWLFGSFHRLRPGPWACRQISLSRWAATHGPHERVFSALGREAWWCVPCLPH